LAWLWGGGPHARTTPDDGGDITRVQWSTKPEHISCEFGIFRTSSCVQTCTEADKEFKSLVQVQWLLGSQDVRSQCEHYGLAYSSSRPRVRPIDLCTSHAARNTHDTYVAMHTDHRHGGRCCIVQSKEGADVALALHTYSLFKGRISRDWSRTPDSTGPLVHGPHYRRCFPGTQAVHVSLQRPLFIVGSF